ncbi:alpha/beta fold hydrolase [Cyanobium sp. WAJ14-Wanaka]|nr:alpha/beta fold hydrolase [Cyanobium sp. WAJ14-Wanaka]
MHGWAGDSGAWGPWSRAVMQRGWGWQSGERGYGALEPVKPQWASEGPAKVVIGHSFGPHALPAELLAQADAVVLLASFGRFVPEGRPGRRLESALAVMADQLRGQGAEAMLQAFLAKAAFPADPGLLPHTLLEQPLGARGREKLQADLALLGATGGLPTGFPKGARVLIVEAGQDQIVAQESRQALRESLPHADWLLFQNAGHCLLETPVLAMVMGWLEALA